MRGGVAETQRHCALRGAQTRGSLCALALYHCNKLRQGNPAIDVLRRLGTLLLHLNEILDRNVALSRSLSLDVVFFIKSMGHVDLVRRIARLLASAALAIKHERAHLLGKQHRGDFLAGRRRRSQLSPLKLRFTPVVPINAKVYQRK